MVPDRRLVDRLEDLFVRRVAPGGKLGVDQVAVNDHLERATARIDELNVAVFVPFLKGIRQTGGFGTVVSNDAVLDGYVHSVSRAVRSDVQGGQWNEHSGAVSGCKTSPTLAEVSARQGPDLTLLAVDGCR